MAVEGPDPTSRQGRWHNARFRTIAETIGHTITRNDVIGWSVGPLARHSPPDEQLGPGCVAFGRGVVQPMIRRQGGSASRCGR